MNRCKGFTLAELAIAFLIIALLLYGALVPLSAQVEMRNIADTQRTMEQIKEAIIGFAQINGRLPCPAIGKTAAGTTDTQTWPPGQFPAGVEQYDTTNRRCYEKFGVVPWTTLATPQTDAWGRRFTYRVSPAFADAMGTTWESNLATVPTSAGSQTSTAPCNPVPAPTQTSSFALCTLGDVAVFTRSSSSTAAVPVGSALAAVFLSHGRNGYGAWQNNGIRLTPLPTAGDEGANMRGDTTAPASSGIAYNQQAFFSRDPTGAALACSDPAPGAPSSSSPLCEFDDLVAMISSQVLVSRMVSAGKLP